MLRWTDVRDAIVLATLASVLGLLHLALRGDALPWIAAPPDPDAAACASEEAVEALVQHVAIQDAIALLDREDVTFVDARSGRDYADAHIPGAITLPASDAAGLLEIQSLPIPPQNLVVTYCEGRSCEQSEYLGLLLRDRVGCEQVLVLEGGWSAWVEAGAPILTGVADHG